MKTTKTFGSNKMKWENRKVYDTIWHYMTSDAILEKKSMTQSDAIQHVTKWENKKVYDTIWQDWQNMMSDTKWRNVTSIWQVSVDAIPEKKSDAIMTSDNTMSHTSQYDNMNRYLILFR